MYNATVYNKKYYQQNKEREKARGRADYQTNRLARRASNILWVKTHIEERRRSARDMHTRRRALINSIKNIPCADCGIKYSPWVMQFDHRDPSEKLFTVGVKITLSLKRVMAEIAKCDIVCANCHAERTHKQPNNTAHGGA